MSLDVKLDTATTKGSIPQEQGKLKIKLSESTDPNLILKDVKQVYRKINATGSETELVWQISTPPDTSITTQDTPNPPQCGVCSFDQLRYWPILPTSTSNERWDCVIWSDTGRSVDLIPTGVVFRDPDVPAPANPEYYADAAVIAPNSSSFFLPPPPNHVLMDYTTYGLSDRIAIVDNIGYVQKPGEVLGLLGATEHAAFRGFLDAKYRIRCDLFASSGSTIQDLVCNLDPRPPLISEVPLCACIGGANCNETTVPTPILLGQTCSTLEGIIDPDNAYANKIIDSGCVNTTPTNSGTYSVECNPDSCNVCHGYPALITNTLGDSNLNGTPMHHRQVGYLPNVLLGDSANIKIYGEEAVRTAMFDAAYKFTDLAIINDDGCNIDDCPLSTPEGNPERCPGSAWYARIFLPFYVNVPVSHTDPTATEPAVSLYGKRIKFSKQGDIEPPPHPLYLNYATLSAIYKNYPPLAQMSHLINGYIRASCIVLGNEWDFITGYNQNKLIWGAVGYPHYDLNKDSKPTHSHQVVLELGSLTTGQCNECWFTSIVPPYTGTEEVQQGPSIDLNRFVLYPITNAAGTSYTPKFEDMLTKNLQSYSSIVGGTGGINSLNIINNIFPITITDGIFKVLQGSVYTDTFNGSDVTTTAPVPCGNILATIQQPPIVHPQGEDTDCACIII